MTPDDFKKLLDRYTRGDCTPGEINFVEEWFNSVHQRDQSIPDNTRQKLWHRVRPVQEVPRENSRILLKIAASVTFLIVAAAAIYFSTLTRPKTALGEAKEIPLPELAPEGVTRSIQNDQATPITIALEDGSIVTLQPNSSIKVPDRFALSERIVSLRGEAFFDIRRDTQRPFYVYSGEVVTKVLGTSFTIKALDTEKKITVSVKTGKVSVFTNPKIKQTAPEVILTPNQKAIYDRNDIVVHKEIVEKPEIILAQPTIFKMKYDETPVTEILRVLEENYGVEIEYEADQLRNCVLTTSMSDEGLFERIEVICKAIGATYKMENAVIRIEGKGC